MWKTFFKYVICGLRANLRFFSPDHSTMPDGQPLAGCTWLFHGFAHWVCVYISPVGQVDARYPAAGQNAPTWGMVPVWYVNCVFLKIDISRLNRRLN